MSDPDSDFWKDSGDEKSDAETYSCSMPSLGQCPDVCYEIHCYSPRRDGESSKVEYLLPPRAVDVADDATSHDPPSKSPDGEVAESEDEGDGVGVVVADFEDDGDSEGGGEAAPDTEEDSQE